MESKLSELKADFSKWRDQRKGPASKTPPILKQRTLDLLGPAKVSRLISELGLSYSALKSLRTELLN